MSLKELRNPALKQEEAALSYLVKTMGNLVWVLILEEQYTNCELG